MVHSSAPWNDCIGKCYLFIDFAKITLCGIVTDVVFSHEDDVYYAKYIIKGEKDIKKNHDYTILRQVFDMAREGGDDWVEDRFYKGKKIE